MKRLLFIPTLQFEFSVLKPDIEEISIAEIGWRNNRDTQETNRTIFYFRP